MEEESFETRPTKRRSWDDEYVLKRQFSALIPAFDPRPGRTNINQTTGTVYIRVTNNELDFCFNTFVVKVDLQIVWVR